MVSKEALVFILLGSVLFGILLIVSIIVSYFFKDSACSGEDEDKTRECEAKFGKFVSYALIGVGLCVAVGSIAFFNLKPHLSEGYTIDSPKVLSGGGRNIPMNLSKDERTRRAANWNTYSNIGKMVDKQLNKR